ncbi:MAG: zinc ribbon domain-containing protein [Candidatus Atabeyarchaeum deiterrae]
MEQTRAYTAKHGEGENQLLRSFIGDYRSLLQEAIDEVWSRTTWREESNKGPWKGVGNRRDATRRIPFILGEGTFKHHELRGILMKGWEYSKHYVDSAIKQAYSVMNSWRRNYVKGYRRAEKPVVRRRFIRVKETLYTYRKGIIRVSVKPNQEYVEFDVSKAWFQRRAKGMVMGELILKDDSLTVTFRRRGEQPGEMIAPPVQRLAWDSNEASLDAFNPRLGWVRVDLSQVYHAHRVYELKRKHMQQVASKKPSVGFKLGRYSARERNRVKDLIQKETSKLARFPAVQHFFEDLDKEKMYTWGRSHNRRLSKSDWKMFQAFLAYKTGKPIRFLNPYNTTRRCSRCGGVNKAPNGARLVECRFCGLSVDRQLNAAVNLYLQMEGLPPSPNLFTELMAGWSGFTQTGDEADALPDELGREARLMSPQSYEKCLRMTT